MLRIGLTGGIGSGKSTVASIFKALGIPVFDADTAAKKVMEEDEKLIQSIKNKFGDNTYNQGKLDRKYLASIVFADKNTLEELNALVHPAAIEAGKKWASTQNAPYIIKEAALIFEAASGDNLDCIIGVTAPKALRIKRVMQRDNISREDVLARINKQIDDSIKMKLCDFVITNDEQQLLVPQVLKLHKQFKK